MKIDNRWKNLEPISEEEMNIVGNRVTICELMRQIYNKTDDPEIKLKCRQTAGLAKKITMMLTKAKGYWWGREVYPLNPEKHKEIIDEYTETNME